MKSILWTRISKVISLLMLLVILIFSFALPNSSAWFTHSQSLEDQVVMGHIELQVSEASSSQFATTVQTQSVTVLGEDENFESAISILSITFTNVGSVPLYIDGDISLDPVASGSGLLFFLWTQNSTPSSYYTEITTGLADFEFTTVQAHLASMNAANLYDLSTISLNPLEVHTIKLVVWIDYYEANLGNVAFNFSDYLLNLNFAYTHSINPQD